MVSTIRYFSGKGSKPTGRPGFLLVLFIAAVGMAAWFWSQYVLLGLAAVYVTHGIVLWLLRPLFVRKSAG
jgi:phosphatidylserine synthase